MDAGEEEGELRRDTCRLPYFFLMEWEPGPADPEPLLDRITFEAHPVIYLHETTLALGG
jgi:hypothetical protein